MAEKGNAGLPFGLCKKYEIQLPENATPRDAWEALKEKTGKNPDQIYDELEKNKTTATAGTKISEDTKQALRDYASGKYAHYCQMSTLLQNGENLDKYKKDHFQKYEFKNGEFESTIDEDNFNKELQKTKDIIESINNSAPDSTPLYRIERYLEDKPLKEGEVVQWGIRSTTRDKGFIDRVLVGKEDGFDNYIPPKQGFYVYEITGNKKHLDIAKYSKFDQSESLINGKFKVVSVKSRPKFESKYKKQSFEEALKEYPDNFKMWKSKRGTNMVTLPSGESFAETSLKYETFINGRIYDYAVEDEMKKEKEAYERTPTKVVLEQVL